MRCCCDQGFNLRVGDDFYMNFDCVMYWIVRSSRSGSVVTRDVPARVLVGGDPRRVLRALDGP